MPENVHTILAEAADAGQRLDKFLSAQLPQLSRSRLQALIKDGFVLCNDRSIIDISSKVKPGQTYIIRVPAPVESKILPQNIPLTIMYEDDDLLVINKPAGLTVHPAPGHPDSTLVNALLAHCGATLSGIGGVARPGIVHRIDKDTSGLLVVAKNDAAHAALSKQLSGRTLTRVYSALVWGTLKTKQGTITGNIGRSPKNRKKMAMVRTGGREAITHYKLVDRYEMPAISLLECKLETGRTHQIRVHLASLGHALVGDPAYGQSTKTRLAAIKSLPAAIKTALLAFNRQALHAREIAFIHPRTGKKMRFECELPDDMKKLLRQF